MPDKVIKALRDDLLDNGHPTDDQTDERLLRLKILALATNASKLNDVNIMDTCAKMLAWVKSNT